MARLSLEGVHLQFGGVTALAGVSLEVQPGDFLAIIGPNGAGKTSIFNCISGIYAPSRGCIRFDGRDITALRPHRCAHLGIARTFQNIALFKGMSVLDNIKIGRHIHLHAGVLASGVYYGRAAREERLHRAVIEREIIDLLELQDIRHKIVGTLPYGLQKRVELARALALDPTVLLLDEPTSMLDVGHQQQVLELVDGLRGDGRLTVLSTLHDLTAAGQYAQDGQGELSPYAQAMIDALREPGIEMPKVFRRISAHVEAASKGTQIPTVVGNWPGEDLYVSQR